MTVRAKFVVVEKIETPCGKYGPDVPIYTKVNLTAVYQGITDETTKVTRQAVEENRIFGEATPQANVSLSIANRAAADQFKTGQFYYVDFIPAS